MRQPEPPRIANWLLRHCTPGVHNEALAGDLLEEYHSGRSKSWYWRQVLAICSIACFREIVDHRGMLVFAALWSLLAPAWLLFIFKMENQFNIVGPIWRMAWPLSTLCIFSLSVAEKLIFVWAGMLVYAVPQTAIRKIFGTLQFMRGLFVSLVVFVAVSSAMLALAMLLPFSGHSINQVASTPLRHIAYLVAWAVLDRVPFLISLICALWSVTFFSPNGQNRIAA